MDAQETYLTRAAFGRLRGRDQLRHSLQVIGVLLLFPGEGRAVRARGARGWGVGGPGAGPGRCAESSQVLGPEPRGQTRPGRASAGARGCKCAMRARRGECVSPLSPSSPASPLVRLSSERTPKPQRLGTAHCPRSLAAAHSKAGSGEQRRPRVGARVPAQLRARVEARRGASEPRGDCRGSGRLQAPPAGRPSSSPFLSTPLLHPARPAGKPDRFAAAAAAGASAAVRLGARVLSYGRGSLSRVPRPECPGRRAGAARAPGFGRSLQVSRASRELPGGSPNAASGLSRLFGIGLPPASGR